MMKSPKILRNQILFLLISIMSSKMLWTKKMMMMSS